MIKIIRRIIDILFIIIIVMLTGYFVLRNSKMIEIYEVETGSMEDGIHPGDYVLIYRKDSYDVGDIVTYTKDGYYVTHRIIREDSDGVVTKGDANNTEDEEIDRSSIVGKVVIIGGILNIIIDYKYAIISLLLGIYLLSCYFGKDKKEEIIVKKDKIRLKRRIRPEYRDKI